MVEVAKAAEDHKHVTVSVRFIIPLIIVWALLLGC